MSIKQNSNKISKNKNSYKHDLSSIQVENKLTKFFDKFKATAKNTITSLLPVKSGNLVETKEQSDSENSFNDLQLTTESSTGNNKIYGLVTKFLNEKGSKSLSTTECEIIKTLLDHSSSSNENIEVAIENGDFLLEDGEKEENINITLGPKISKKLLETISYKPEYDEEYTDADRQSSSNLNILNLKNGKRIFDFSNKNIENGLPLSSLESETINIINKDTSKKSVPNLLKNNEEAFKYDTPAANYLVEVLKESKENLNNKSLEPPTGEAELDYIKLLNPYTKKQNNSSLPVEKQNKLESSTKRFLENTDTLLEHLDDGDDGDDDDVLVLDDDMIADEDANEAENKDDEDDSPNDYIINSDNNVEDSLSLSENQITSSEEDEVDLIDHEDLDIDENNEDMIEKNSTVNSDESEEEEKLLKEEEAFILKDLKENTQSKAIKSNDVTIDDASRYAFPDPTFLKAPNQSNQINQSVLDEYLKIYTF